LLFSTAEEPSSVASCGRNFLRDDTEEGSSAVENNNGRTFFRMKVSAFFKQGQFYPFT